MRVLILILLIIFCLKLQLYAQKSESYQIQVEKDIERILEEHDPEVDSRKPEEMIRELLDFAANPLNINRASVDELQLVPGITVTLAYAIVSYRNEIKLFESKDELVNVSGVGTVTLTQIAPYLSIGNPSEQRKDIYLNPKIWLHNSRLDVYSRYRRPVQTAEGYTIPDTSGGYLGNPVNYYQRIQLKSNHLSMNITQQKSPGEYLNGPLQFHHNTFNISLHNLGRLRKLVAGDFSVRTGQGLILRNSSVFGKGRDVIRSANRTSGGPTVREFSSANSENAFRGIAFTYGNSLRFTGFYSFKKRSSSVVNGDTIRFPVNTITYNTNNQLDRRHNTHQQTAGGRVSVELPSLSAGFNGYLNNFDRPVRTGTQPYQLHAFEGKRIHALSFDYNLRLNRLNLFGEAGKTDNSAYGLISGLKLSQISDFEIAVGYRNYSHRFQSIFGGSFAEQSGTPRNEEGFYIGLSHNVSESIRISAYADQFHFPAPRFQLSRPASGYDWLGMIEYNPDRDTEVYLLARQKVRGHEYYAFDAFGRSVLYPGTNQRIAFRLHFGKQIHTKIRIRNRAEFVSTDSPSNDGGIGYLVYQDIRYQARHNLQIDARITFFETDGFEQRLYHFENDLLYVFSSTMLFAQGQRMYILINYQPVESVRIWFKAATTIYENRKTIGSGRNRIPGNVKSDIGIQVRVRI
jgi:competence ComEA-like helix-hairpin-helix protein